MIQKIYWIFKWNGWYLQKYWRIQSKYKTKTIDHIRWYDLYACNKSLNPIVTKVFIRGAKLNISLVFITQSFFAVLKSIRLNTTHYFVMNIPNKRERRQIAFNHFSDIHHFSSFKTLWIFIKSVLQNHNLFWLLILLLHQIIFYVLERVLQKEYRS